MEQKPQVRLSQPHVSLWGQISTPACQLPLCACRWVLLTHPGEALLWWCHCSELGEDRRKGYLFCSQFHRKSWDNLDQNRTRGDRFRCSCCFSAYHSVFHSKLYLKGRMGRRFYPLHLIPDLYVSSWVYAFWGGWIFTSFRPPCSMMNSWCHLLIRDGSSSEFSQGLYLLCSSF